MIKLPRANPPEFLFPNPIPSTESSATNSRILYPSQHTSKYEERDERLDPGDSDEPLDEVAPGERGGAVLEPRERRETRRSDQEKQLVVASAQSKKAEVGATYESNRQREEVRRYTKEDVRRCLHHSNKQVNGKHR